MAATSGGSPAAGGDPIIFGVLTVSDRASSGVYADEGGPAILGFFDEAVASELRFLYIYIFFSTSSLFHLPGATHDARRAISSLSLLSLSLSDGPPSTASSRTTGTPLKRN
jgi:hypothetical protein